MTGFDKNDDGTYRYGDIKYDDGDTDEGLHKCYLSTNVRRFADHESVYLDTGKMPKCQNASCDVRF